VCLRKNRRKKLLFRRLRLVEVIYIIFFLFGYEEKDVIRAENIDINENKNGNTNLLIKEKRLVNFVLKNKITKESKELLR
jgi:hypothetical protein